ncbi:MAG: heavy metal translocating P-type ATPase [Ignavibacteria bacterium]
MIQYSQDFKTETSVSCFHCGEKCPDTDISIEEKYFCCTGCKLVYEILEQNKLCKYYDIDSKAGNSLKNAPAGFGSRFAFLEDEQIKNKLIDFTDGKITAATFFIPHIHCSSCIWLLENLYKLNKGVLQSRVDFLQKKLSVKFKEPETNLRKIVELISTLGYEPKISLDDAEKKHKLGGNKKLYYKIGIAGFCFGNVMLLSFPEYLSFGNILDITYKQFFGYLNILLSLPVILFCSSDYFKSAYAGLKQKKINIDFPISLGLLALFLRSVSDVLLQTGPGFFDSMTGLVFFLLIGKIFQSKTYDVLNFERNYKSYFPVSVTVKKSGTETTKPVSRLEAGDRIIIRNNELVPADAILFTPRAGIDYSFVTGESVPVEKVMGEIVYAGGRQAGGAIELEVIRTVSQSYLTRLWNNDAFVKKDETRFDSMVNVIGKYFTLFVLVSALAASAFWLNESLSKAVYIFSAMLIVACPCGIALTGPFALGNAMRIFGRNKLYLKNTSIVERMSRVNSIVFDKTGTITHPGNSTVSFIGSVLTSFEQGLVKSIVRNSTHPLSSYIYNAIKEQKIFEVANYIEHSGKGIEGDIGTYKIKLGEKYFVTGNQGLPGAENRIEDSKVYLSINGEQKGYFSISNVYREGIDRTIWDLAEHYRLALLSGDNSGEKQNLLRFFNNPSKLHFNQSPAQKLNYVKSLQEDGNIVMMVGDGLNDAGALKQSDVGLAISEDLIGFTPACDGIIEASGIQYIDRFLKFSIATRKVVILSFIISLIYNFVGISLAFAGKVSPMLAAVLMPLSSILVVLFTILSTNLVARKRGLL